jgi:hypothetical protein
MSTVLRDISIDNFYGLTGLAGTLAVRVVDADDATLVARSTTGVTEFPAGSGCYHKKFTAWDTAWAGRVIWDDTINFYSQPVGPLEASSVIGGVGGNVSGSVIGNLGGSVVGDVNGNVVGTVAAVLGDVGGDVAGDVQGTVQGDLSGDLYGNFFGSMGGTAPADIAAGVWDYLTASAATVGSFGKKIKDWVLGTDNKAILSANAQTGVVIPRVTLVDTVTTVTNNPATGSGPYAIDHDGGSGLAAADCTFYIPSTNVSGVGSSTDLLRYTTDGSTGNGGLTLRAYLASDYDAGVRNAVAISSTNADGRWAAPLFLTSGTFYITADAPGDGFAAHKIKVVVP